MDDDLAYIVKSMPAFSTRQLVNLHILLQTTTLPT